MYESHSRPLDYRKFYNPDFVIKNIRVSQTAIFHEVITRMKRMIQLLDKLNLRQWQDKFLFLAIIFLIFDNIPKYLQLNFLSNGQSCKLTWYCLFIFLLLFGVRKVKENLFFTHEERKFLIYMLLYFLLLLASNIMGIIQYPFYDDLLLGPASQIEKLPNVIAFLQSFKIDVSYETLLLSWIDLRSIKLGIFTVIYTFGFSFAIYYFIKNNWKQYITLLEKAIFISLGIICLYSLVEVFYLAGNEMATAILSTVNPFLHPIAVDHNWWPPLLWKGQLRSVFSEPSRMGNYAAFILPFLWGRLVGKEKMQWKILVVTVLYTFLIFLTKARTPIGIYWGMLVLFFAFGFGLGKKKFFKKALIILCISAASFSASLFFINSFMVSKSQDTVTASEYLEDNIGSLTSSNKRSNGARYALIRSNLKTGIEHPILGVGDILTPSYTVANFTENDLNNREVSMWVNDYYEQGPLKYDLDGMNEYVSQFAKHGLVGLLLFLFPGIYAILGLLKKIKYASGEQQRKIAVVLMSLIGTLVAGCNGSLTLLYTYWIILAYSYAIIFGTYQDSSVEELKKGAS